MGEVIGLEENFGEIFLDLVVEKKELFSLKGNFKEIGIFCSDLNNCKTDLLKKGLLNTTHYIKLPLEIKTKKKEEWKRIFIQKLEEKNNIYFLFKFERD